MTSLKTISVLMALFALGTVPALAQSNPRGFVDGSAFERFADEDGEVVEVNLPNSMLKSLANSLSGGDKETSRVLTGLHSVRALIVTIDPAKVDEAMKEIESTAKSLLSRGWSEIAKVRSKEERIRVLARNENDKIGGLLVLIVSNEEGDGDGPELVFANIAGTIDLKDIEKLSGSNLPGMRELGEASRGALKGE